MIALRIWVWWWSKVDYLRDKKLTNSQLSMETKVDKRNFYGLIQNGLFQKQFEAKKINWPVDCVLSIYLRGSNDE